MTKLHSFMLVPVCLLAACSASTTTPSTSGDVLVSEESQVLIQSVAFGELELRFYGEVVPSGISPRYGVERMAVGTPQGEVAYSPQGELFHSDWNFEIVSPDGSMVLLLQDHYGPYHIVSLENFQAYLSNGDPDHEFGQLQPDSNAWVHEQAQWISDSEISYVAGLTSVSEYRFTLSD